MTNQNQLIKNVENFLILTPKNFSSKINFLIRTFFVGCLVLKLFACPKINAAPVYFYSHVIDYHLTI